MQQANIILKFACKTYGLAFDISTPSNASTHPLLPPLEQVSPENQISANPPLLTIFQKSANPP